MGYNPDQPRVPAGDSHGGEFGKDVGGTSRPTDGDLVKFTPLKTTGGDSAFKDFITEDPEFAADFVAINEHDRQAFEDWADAHPDNSKIADLYDNVITNDSGNTAQATLEDGTQIHALSDSQYSELTKQNIPGVSIKRLGQDQESLIQMFDDLSTKEVPIAVGEARNLSGVKTRSKDFQPIARQVKGSLYLVHYPDSDTGRGGKNDTLKFQSADELETARANFAKAHPDFFRKKG